MYQSGLMGARGTAVATCASSHLALSHSGGQSDVRQASKHLQHLHGWHIWAASQLITSNED